MLHECHVTTILYDPAFRYAILCADDYQKENLVRTNDKPIDDNLFHKLQRMFAYLDLSERKDYNPAQFCYSFKDWDGNPVNVAIQQDSHEFLTKIFDKLEQSLSKTPYKSILDTIFAGKTVDVITCQNCKFEKTRREVFFNLKVPNHPGKYSQ